VIVDLVVQEVVVATGVPIRVQYVDEDGNPIELSPIQEKFDEAVHVWEAKGSAVEEVTCFLGTPISLQDACLRRSTQQTKQCHLVFYDGNSP
jgi:hypothetical protein